VALQDRLHGRHDAGFPIDQGAVAVKREVGEVFELDQGATGLRYSV
jgi:hypothetical protein